MKKTIWKSLWAIFAGFIVVIVLSIVTDMVVEGLGIFPGASHPELYTWWMLLVALFYRTIYTVLGGYVTAFFAPNKKLKHAVILGILGTVAGAAGAVANWNMGNQWYPIALVVLAIPSTWLGGKIQGKK